MLNLVRRHAEQKVFEKSVTVSAHRDEIAMFLAHPANDFRRRISVRELRFDWNSRRLELQFHFREIALVVIDLFADSAFAIRARGPAVGDVEEHDAAVELPRQGAHVLEDRAVGGGRVQGHEDLLPHKLTRLPP